MSENTEVRSEWGRVTEDGTVYVRTSDGERSIGSWLAGTPEEGLAYYRRRFDDLATEVALLEHRVLTDADPAGVRTTAARLRESLTTATVVGDLGDLDRRLAAVVANAEMRNASVAAQRQSQQAAATEQRRALVAEAEQLAQSTQWKVAGDRLRTIGDDWKAIPRGDKRTDDELWKQLRTAREEFNRRRGAHFAALDEQRKESQSRKEALVAEAESLATSTDWAPTAARFKSMMTDWKAAGSAPRAADDALWQRFRTAQDTFFAARSGVFSERDDEQRRNQAAKEALIVEAEALDPEADFEEAQRRLRDIQERYDAVGHVPRDAVTRLERRMEAAQSRVREAADARWRRTNVESSPLVTRLRESVAKLEEKARKARAAGRDADAEAAEQARETQRQWLAQAESS